MVRLAAVPGNSVDEIMAQGAGATLSRYYNPGSFFEDVYVLSPFETRAYDVAGIHVIPTKDTELPAALSRLHIDVVRGYGGATPADVVVYYRARGIPVIVSVHDKRPSMLHASIRLADAVFVVSDELKVVVASMGVRPERIFVVPNGVDDALMRPMGAPARDVVAQRLPFKYRLLHVGRKSPEKNIEAILRALVRLGPDYGFMAVGQGDVARYETLAARLGVACQCVFTSGVEQQELVHLYSGADCVCHPSRSEAMCNVLLEALACGAAVVTTETAARGLGPKPLQALRVIADPEDDEALARQVHLVCTDSDERQALRDKARASVEHLFLEKTQAHEAACYRAVLKMQTAGEFRRSLVDKMSLVWANGARRLGRTLKRCR